MGLSPDLHCGVGTVSPECHSGSSFTGLGLDPPTERRLMECMTCIKAQGSKLDIKYVTLGQLHIYLQWYFE